jgi:hypothetical protein
MKLFFVTMFLCLSFILSAEILFDELGTINFDNGWIEKIWIEDYNDNGEDNILILSNHDIVYVYDNMGTLIHEYQYIEPKPTIMKDIDEFELSWRTDFFSEIDSVAFSLDLLDPIDQNIVSSILIPLGPNQYGDPVDFDVKKIAVNFINEQFCIFIGGNYNTCNDSNENSRNKTLIINLNNINELTHLYTIDNYGSAFYFNSPNNTLIFRGDSSSCFNDMNGYWDEVKSLKFGKFDFNTNTLSQEYHSTGSIFGGPGGTSYIEYPNIFNIYSNNSDSSNVGYIRRFYDYSSSYNSNSYTLTNDRIICWDQVLDNINWIRTDTYIQMANCKSFKSTRLYHHFGDNYIIFFGFQPNGQKLIELVNIYTFPVLQNLYLIHQ